jgi:hypothetical protein
MDVFLVIAAGVSRFDKTPKLPVHKKLGSSTSQVLLRMAEMSKAAGLLTL